MVKAIRVAHHTAQVAAAGDLPLAEQGMAFGREVETLAFNHTVGDSTLRISSIRDSLRRNLSRSFLRRWDGASNALSKSLIIWSTDFFPSSPCQMHEATSFKCMNRPSFSSIRTARPSRNRHLTCGARSYRSEALGADRTMRSLNPMLLSVSTNGAHDRESRDASLSQDACAP